MGVESGTQKANCVCEVRGITKCKMCVCGRGHSRRVRGIAKGQLCARGQGHNKKQNGYVEPGV